MSSSGPPHVHAPHGGVHSWRDFFVHIAIITIGLLLALGLEQIVQSIHHEHQRAQLEEQMRETFVANARIDQENLRVMGDIRNYLVGLHRAADASRKGQAATMPTPPDNTYITQTTLGPFEAARENGTIALLGLDRIRLYNRIASQHEFVALDLAEYRKSNRALSAFRKRFDTASTYDRLLIITLPPDLAALSGAELAEYQQRIADALESIDQFVLRTRRLENQTRAILNGAHDESELIRATVIVQDSGIPAPSGGGK